VCGEILKESGKGLIFRAQEDRLAALYMPAENDQSAGLPLEVCRRIQETLEQLFDITTPLSLSGVHHEAAEMGAAYREARQALESSFFDRGARVYVYRREAVSVTALPPDLEQAKERFFDVRTLGDLAGIERTLEAIVQRIRRHRSPGARTVRRLFLDFLYHLIELLRSEKIPLERVWGDSVSPAEAVERADDLFELHELLRRFLGSIQAHIEERDADRHGHAVELIKAFVSEHCRERLPLSRLARQVALSPNYVCRLFKRETGETLTAYVHRQKVEVAKKLLAEGKRAMEVAEELQFAHESYFIKVFKRHTGMTTTEFVRGVAEPIESPTHRQKGRPAS
jgi:two-component system response regulator YesN